MDAIMKRVAEYSLSNEDINNILGNDTKVLVYPNFRTMRHIDEAFDPEGRCVFLFLTESQNVGHWLCMFKRNGYIEYFDSYGKPPEDQRNWLTQDQLDALDESEPYLYNLLRRSRYKVYYNCVPYQTDRKDINTCGRWVAARLLCKELDNKAFYNLVKKSGLMPDKWVSYFTFNFIGK